MGKTERSPSIQDWQSGPGALQLGGFGLGGDEDKSGMTVAQNLWTKEMAATEEGGHFD